MSIRATAYLVLDVHQACWIVNSKADEEDVGFWIGQGAQAVVIFLASRVPKGELDQFILVGHRCLVVFEDCWDVGLFAERKKGEPQRHWPWPSVKSRQWGADWPLESDSPSRQSTDRSFRIPRLRRRRACARSQGAVWSSLQGWRHTGRRWCRRRGRCWDLTTSPGWTGSGSGRPAASRCSRRRRRAGGSAGPSQMPVRGRRRGYPLEMADAGMGREYYKIIG